MIVVVRFQLRDFICMKGEVIDQMYLGMLEGQIILRKECGKATFCIEAVQRTQRDRSRQGNACREVCIPST